VSVQERRRFRRVPISTRIEAQAGDESLIVTAENISPGGMLIRAPKTLPEGMQVTLVFTLPGSKREFRITGTVQHVSPNAFMGVRFENLSDDDKQAITIFVDSKETTV
jgi:uncharacterized protein (TIGR02266 family)